MRSAIHLRFSRCAGGFCSHDADQNQILLQSTVKNQQVEQPPEPPRPSQSPSSDETQAPLAVKSRLRGFAFYKNEVFTRALKKLTLEQTSSNLKGCTTSEKNKTILRNETSEDKPKLGVTALQERGVGHWTR